MPRRLRAGSPDAPVCTTCHGEHQILDPADPNAPVAARNLSLMVCGTCHASVKLNERYGLANDRVQTFADSYHGLATRGGAVVAVNCASCHGAHAIRPSSDPLSPVNRGESRADLRPVPRRAPTRASRRAPVHVTATAGGQEPGGLLGRDPLRLADRRSSSEAWSRTTASTSSARCAARSAIQKGLIVEEPCPTGCTCG